MYTSSTNSLRADRLVCDAIRRMGPLTEFEENQLVKIIRIFLSVFSKNAEGNSYSKFVFLLYQGSKFILKLKFHSMNFWLHM